MPNENKIRPYGPGKFNTILDAYVYSVSLDGCCDDEFGSCSENGFWNCLMKHGRSIFKDHDPLLESLNQAEQTKLTECAGVILCENDQGFVTVEYFDDETSLMKEWERIQADFLATFPNEDDEDDEGTDPNVTI